MLKRTWYQSNDRFFSKLSLFVVDCVAIAVVRMAYLSVMVESAHLHTILVFCSSCCRGGFISVEKVLTSSLAPLFLSMFDFDW